MPSGTLSLGKSKQTEGQLIWTATANGTAANSSTVTATLQVRRWDGNYTTTGTWTGKITIGGTTESFSCFTSVNGWTTVKTMTVTVNHNSDGSGTCYIYGFVNGPTETTQQGATVSGFATATLDTIARYASLTAVTNFNDEDSNLTVDYSNPAGETVTSLQACISLDGTTANIEYREIPKTGTSYTFALTEDEKNTLRAATPNSNTLDVYVLLKTVIGSGSDVKSAAAQMRIVNADPTISPSVVDTNSTTINVTGNRSILVANQSTAQVTFNAAAKKYATIATRRLEHGAQVLNADGTLSVTYHPFRFIVTDSRGNSVTQDANNTIVPYFNPTCSIGNNLPATDGTFSLVVTGLFYNGSIGKTSNSITVQYRMKPAGGSYGSWTNISAVSQSGNNYTATANLTGLDYRTVYTFQARAIDVLNTGGVASAEKAVVSQPVFDWGKNDFRFNVPVEMPMNGLGVIGYNAKLLTDADEGIRTGWYRLDSSTLNGVGVSAVMRVDSYSGNMLLQTAFSGGYSSAYPLYQERWRINNGLWGEWEWVNPPMVLGVEYRTTERWQGKAVYTKLTNCGGLGSSTTSITTTIPASAYVLRHHETMGGIPLPFYYSSGNATLRCHYNNDANFKIIEMFGHVNYAGRTVISQAWYTKD